MLARKEANEAGNAVNGLYSARGEQGSAAGLMRGNGDSFIWIPYTNFHTVEGTHCGNRQTALACSS